MTENEAIKAIEHDLEWHSKELQPKYKEVLRYAIQALSEIQQYRAIGTVEEFQHFITAWDELKILIDIAKNELSQYKSIGTIEEFKALKEKNEPKKVVVEHIPKTSWTKEISHYLCPSCRSIFSFGGKPYCSNCGQKLDWE